MSAAPPAPTPGRWGYGLAALVGILTLGAFVWVLFVEVLAIGDDLRQVVVPGSRELTLEAGSYTIFHEQNSAVDGRIFGSVDARGLVVRLFDSDGRPVPMSDATGGSYRFGLREGRSVFTADIAAAGSYHLAASYPDGRGDPETVLAIGPSLASTILWTMLWPFAIMLGGGTVAVALAVITYTRRSRASGP